KDVFHRGSFERDRIKVRSLDDNLDITARSLGEKLLFLRYELHATLQERLRDSLFFFGDLEIFVRELELLVRDFFALELGCELLELLFTPLQAGLEVLSLPLLLNVVNDLREEL